MVKETFGGQGLVGRVYEYEVAETEVREVVAVPGLADGKVGVVNPKTGERRLENLEWVLECLSKQPDGARFEGVCELLGTCREINRAVAVLSGEVLRSEDPSASTDMIHGFHAQTLDLLARMKVETERLVQARFAKDFDDELAGEFSLTSSPSFRSGI
ncbi:hypothetical protein [Roseibium sp. RKSG952]|uniref:hypothetical protein n=1 Tax=Roseibium sp. RKSG952 TaxID=2529384 RepID=UPI0012BC2080|nr:hypothetical protein [Roseibium sp. RKSG952]MTH95776.1 hypothetical protein [Roseibium sp. RKSG952]